MTEPLPLPNEPRAYSDLPAGWVEAFSQIVALLDADAPGWAVAQVKEKFAHLNVYWQAPEDMPDEQRRESYARVDETEQSTLLICGVCGVCGVWAHANRPLVPRPCTRAGVRLEGGTGRGPLACRQVDPSRAGAFA